MRRLFPLLFLSSLLVIPVVQARAESVAAERYVVVLNDTVADSESVAAEHSKAYGVRVSYVYREALRGYAAEVPSNRVAALQADRRVLFLSPDREVATFAQSLPTGVDRINAENKANRGTGVNVAVLDTGIDLFHPDLRANIVGGKRCWRGRSYADVNGHGTHVAGTIAALDNDIGVVGVAPEAKLWAVRVLDDEGRGTVSSVICGIDFVDSKSPANGGPITIANMSLGGTGSDDGSCGNINHDAMHKAVCRVVSDGVTVVAAAGNSADDIAKRIPAAYDEVMTVSALADSDGKPCGIGAATAYGPDDTFASFSNFATLSSDFSHLIGAPGVGILSTYVSGGSGYLSLSGTSMAAAHVAGTAALYIATHRGASPGSVMQALKASGERTDTSLNLECLLAPSHTNPSELHPEPVVRADTI